MSYCVSCGSPLPSDQGSRTCSMCYGDPYHGRDGYYLDAMRADYEAQQADEARAQEEEDV